MSDDNSSSNSDQFGRGTPPGRRKRATIILYTYRNTQARRDTKRMATLKQTFAELFRRADVVLPQGEDSDPTKEN